MVEARGYDATSWRSTLENTMSPGLALACGLLVLLARWRGVDLAAHVYDVEQYRRQGLTIWDGQWFGGRWLLGYSVLYSPIAAAIGLRLTAVASAAAAAWCFDRLLRSHFGGSVVWLASGTCAVGTVAQVAIGQLPYLLGEGFALVALILARRRWWVPAAAFAAATTLASPLAGAFLALAMVAWLLGTWPDRRVWIALLAIAALAPVLPIELLFPQGTMSFPFPDFALELAAFLLLVLLVPATERTIRIGAAAYTSAIVASYLLPTAVGGTVIRLGGCVALPIALCAIGGTRRVLAVLALVPVLVLTSAPVWASATTGRTDDSTRSSFYAPLVAYLTAHAQPAGRVEVVPTALHWESVYVAPSVPLARGWERQLDTLDNPIFYQPGALTDSSYRIWLIDAGVRYVALPDAHLDFAGTSEARLVASTPPGLTEVWHDRHWRVYQLRGSHGIVAGPATLEHLSGSRLVIGVTRPGRISIAVRPASRWRLESGDACMESATDDAVTLDARAVGTVTLRLHLLAAPDAYADATVC